MGGVEVTAYKKDAAVPSTSVSRAASTANQLPEEGKRSAEALKADMTPKCDARLVLCIVFVACCCWTLTMAQMPRDCCLSVRNQTIAKQHIANSRLQLRAHGCPLDAMILVTRHGVNLCVPNDEAWVQSVLQHVQWLQTHCRKSNFKTKRCFGVKPQ